MKQKRLKRLLALVLVGTMVFVEPLSAFATEPTEVMTEGTDESTEEESAEKNDSVETGEMGSDQRQEEQGTESVSTEEGSTETLGTEESSTESAGTEKNSEEVSGTEESETGGEETATATEEESESGMEETETEESTTSSIGSEELETLGFKTMTLSQNMKAEKSELSSVMAAMESMDAGEDYLNNEIVYFAESKEEAEQIAECYGGELSEYEYGVAVASIKAEVIDAIKAAADPDIALPAVYPNIVYELYSEDENNEGGNEYIELESATGQDTELEDMVDSGAELDIPCEDEHLYATAPNDTYYDSQWHHNTMNTVEAWNASKGNGILVAVIDSGIDYNHPDLKKNIEGYITTTGYGDGRDDNGHGTHCAGIIAAEADNNTGVAGIAPEAKIYSVKALKANGSGSTADIIQAVAAATDKNVDIISMSLGSICYDSLYQKTIDKAVSKGIVVIAAAGNEGVSQKSYPAAYNNVISVGATGRKDEAGKVGFTNFSNYGSWVDIAAPGLNILSTLPTDFTVDRVTYVADGYGYMSGTSMACPAVAGTVALMLGNSDSLKNANNKSGVSKITKTLLGSATANGAASYYENKYYPLADAEATVYAVDTNIPKIPEPVFFSGNTEQQLNGMVVKGGEGCYVTFDKALQETPHSKIYFTINGAKPTAKTGTLYKGRKPMSNYSGKVKIQAVTVVGNKTSKVFSKTYTFDVKAESLYPYACSDNMTVGKGKSIQLGISFVPWNTTNKKLKWTSDNDMIKVNASNGKVTCNKNAEVGSKAKITAETLDGSNQKYEFTVQVVGEVIDGFELNATTLNMSYWADDENVSMSAPVKYVSTYQLLPKNGEGTKTNQYLYKSSNTKVATVNANGWVTAWGKGKAKITVTANDGSNKKAVCNVVVVTPVFDIYAETSTKFTSYELDNGYVNEIPIGTGCSITVKTQVNYNSKDYLLVPSNKQLVWTSSDSNLASVKNGKVTCTKDRSAIGKTVTITARAKDGFGCERQLRFRITDKITKLYVKVNLVDKITGQIVDTKEVTSINSDLLDVDTVGDATYDFLDYGQLYLKTADGTGNYCRYFMTDTTNKDVVYRYINPDIDTERHIIVATKKGSSKIVYTALDGSNTKFTINFSIKKEEDKERSLNGVK